MNHNHRVYYAFLVLLTGLLVFIITGKGGNNQNTNVSANVIESSDTHINNPKQHHSEIKKMNMMFAKNTEEAKAKYNDVRRKQYEWNMMNHGIHGRRMASENASMNENVLRLQQRKAFESESAERTDMF